MPLFEHRDVRIHYAVSGDPDGPPVLLIAPGGMHSTMDRWRRVPYDPLARLRGHRLVAMDQRNAGGSVAPVADGDGWDRYTEDQLALLDHLGIHRFSIVGMCIGGPYAFGLIRAAPERVKAAVILQPIGLADNRDAFHALFDDWSASLADAHPEATPEIWRRFRSAMFDGDFVFNATRPEVREIATPILLFRGGDRYHPAAISDEIAAMAPDVTLVSSWRDDPEGTGQRVQAFLDAHP